MPGSLNNKRVAILVTDGFEQAELTGPQQALEQAGVKVDIVSAREGKVKVGTMTSQPTTSGST